VLVEVLTESQVKGAVEDFFRNDSSWSVLEISDRRLRFRGWVSVSALSVVVVVVVEEEKAMVCFRRP
jgi:hypothetical protein